jgi:hypothetical protein
MERNIDRKPGWWRDVRSSHLGHVFLICSIKIHLSRIENYESHVLGLRMMIGSFRWCYYAPTATVTYIFLNGLVQNARARSNSDVLGIYSVADS